MSDPLVPSDSNDVENREGFNTLEERIFNTDRDHEREVSTTVRLAVWQDNTMQRINRNIGTNSVEVKVRAYTHGLKTMRQNFKDDAEEISTLMLNIDYLIQNGIVDDDYAEDFLVKLYNVGGYGPKGCEMELTDPQHIAMRDSERSEVNKFFSDWCKLGGWIHRYVVGVGLMDSEHIQPKSYGYAEGSLNHVGKVIHRTKEEYEEVFLEYITRNIPYFLDNPPEGEPRDRIIEVANKIGDNRKQKVIDALSTIDDTIVEEVE